MKNNITAVIIDDERKGRMALRQKISLYCPEIVLVGEAENGIEGVQLILHHSPSIVFLDIEMPQMDGFEMIEALPAMDFHLIFTTAYDHYAIKAIRYAAFDYLLKPIDIEELKSTVRRAREQSWEETQKKWEVLHTNLAVPALSGKIAIPTQQGYTFINISEIMHLEADSNYTYIHVHDQEKYLASRTLKDFEDLLPPDLFFRPHHSHIINLNYIRKYLKADGGQIQLRNGEYVPVSRRKKQEFLELIRS